MAGEKILVVDDMATVRNLIAFHLGKEGFNVITAGDGRSALAAVNTHQPDLIVLDIVLPDLDGIEVCRELRKVNNTPIIFLTAKNEVTDIVLGLGIGGDDYMVKPFNPAEMVARVKANLRRSRLAVSEGTAADRQQVLRYPNLEIDLAGRSVRVRGQPVNLTALEFTLLALLAQNPNKVITTKQLFESAWQYAEVYDDRTLKVHISNLRKKIEPDPVNPTYIITVRGVGYKFNG